MARKHQCEPAALISWAIKRAKEKDRRAGGHTGLSSHRAWKYLP